MAIDNPYDAIDQQFPDDEGGVFSAITKVLSSASALGVPVAPAVVQFFGFLGTLSTKARTERGVAFIKQLIEDIQRHEAEIGKMRTEMAQIQAAMRLSIKYDVDEFDDCKRRRYISAISVAIASGTKVHDLSSFIQDIEQLGERDLIGLKVLNTIMNREGDWKDVQPPSPFNPPRLHPTTFTHRAQELSVAMAHALTSIPTGTDGNTFSREEGLQICLRLQGFGLAQFVDGNTREVPISNYSARLTTRGLMLLKLLGENVPNWNRYFDANGPL